MSEVVSLMLKRGEVATIMNVTVGTLKNWEKEGIGPAPRKFGRTVRYNRAEVNAFVNGLTQAAS